MFLTTKCKTYRENGSTDPIFFFLSSAYMSPRSRKKFVYIKIKKLFSQVREPDPNLTPKPI